MKNILTIIKPQNPLPLVYDSPHSGTIYPDDFHYSCDFSELRKAEDHYVDELFSSTPRLGAAFLSAHFPRSYIDVNRAACDIDTDLLAHLWPEDTHGKIAPTSRSDAGIGLIRRLVRPGVPVYNRPLSADEIQRRIQTYYNPYHTALESLIDEAHYNFGVVYHINCHAMPASSARPRQPLSMIGREARVADFVLGNRDGTTCDHDFMSEIRKFLKNMGYNVTINDPFKGVELVRRFSNPARGRHSLQIEINKSLYMDEETGEKSPNYGALKADIEKLTAFTAAYSDSSLGQLAAD
jgi:N-formylglutamate amidohydrolase